MKEKFETDPKRKAPLKQPGFNFCQAQKTKTGQSDSEAALERAMDKALTETCKTEAILTAIVDGISIQDTNFVVQYQNQAHVEMFGQHLGKPCYSSFEGKEKVCSDCPALKTLEDGKTHTMERSFSKNGKFLHYEVTASPLRNPNGVITGAVEVTRDVTERKMAEEERIRLAAAVKQAAEAIIVTNKKGQILFANPAFLKITGYREDEILGQRINALVGNGQHDEKFHEELWKTLKNGNVWRGRFKNRRKDGTTFDAESAISPICDSSGIITSCVEVSRDITDQLVLQSKVQHVQKLESMGVLAGGIAHDFNNLLVAAMLNADMALGKLPPESQSRPYIKKILKAARSATELTNQMLAYSGKGEFSMEPLELNRLIFDLKYLLETVISKRADLTLNLSPKLPAVNADSSQLSQVIMNLIINASDALEEGNGNILVKTGLMEADREYLSKTFLDENLPEGAYLFLDVSDNGVGMEEETLKQIFDPFFTTKFNGRGLGLAAVLGIVRSHGGALNVTSEPGVGTSFRILLPSTESKPFAANAIIESIENKSMGIKLLLVDDEESILDAAKSMMEDHGFEVVAAKDGQEAVAAYRSMADEINAVILDISMPRMNGAETLLKLREIDSGVKVILTSGYSEKAASEWFGPDDLAYFLKKPYQSLELLEKINSALKS